MPKKMPTSFRMVSRDMGRASIQAEGRLPPMEGKRHRTVTTKILRVEITR
jgi:hypothetical protein